MKNESKAVLVTTEHRGVFFGYLKQENGNAVTLKNARNCVYWSSELKGFIGLATKGPTQNCKIGPAAEELKLFGVTSIADVTAEAAQKWEEAPWSR